MTRHSVVDHTSRVHSSSRLCGLLIDFQRFSLSTRVTYGGSVVRYVCAYVDVCLELKTGFLFLKKRFLRLYDCFTFVSKNYLTTSESHFGGDKSPKLLGIDYRVDKWDFTS